MYQLTVNSPNLAGASVVLIKSTPLPYSIVCGLWPAGGGLKTMVLIGTVYYAYASNYQEELQDGVTISSSTLPLLLSEGYAYRFDGTAFVQENQIPPAYDYALCNERASSLTCGLCQDVTVNGTAAKPPVCVQSVPSKLTAYFQTDDRFWLGVGQFAGLSNPQPGLLLSTSIVEPGKAFAASLGPFAPTLGRFAWVDFSESTPNLVANYRSNMFQIQPDEGGASGGR